MKKNDVLRLNRRDLFKLGGAVLLGSAANVRGTPAFGQTVSVCPVPEPEEILACSGGSPIEVFPTSPLIGGYIDSNGIVKGRAFTQELPIPDPLAPVSELTNPVPSKGEQDLCGNKHQIFQGDTLPDGTTVGPLTYYRLKLQVAAHNFTSLPALPIDVNGNPVIPPLSDNARPRPQPVPASTIYGYNGIFPGPMIYAQYGRPVLVRFENELGENPDNLDRGDFGDPQFRSLTHLHNAHTAPESDGNPGWTEHGYAPGQFVDNLYLNWPPAIPDSTGRMRSDDNEKQSFLWFHDHKERHTGANVYKGLVGIYPIYDPKLDPGDERSSGSEGKALHLPGVPVPSRDPLAPKRVKYDIPLVLFDCALDDGITPHKDFHNGCGETQPRSWGKSFFRHFPNHGFVGDIFTVNGVAYPVLKVDRRKYRFRFLDASIARLYKLMLVTSTDGPQAAPGRQGQYQLPDAQQCMRFTQIASEGGLLPFPIDRDAIELSPAKRREVIVDFSRFMDGCPCTKGDCLYLVNVLDMEDGRKEDNTAFDPTTFCVPILKIEIGDFVPDDSAIPPRLRELPLIDFSKLKDLPQRNFRLERGGGSAIAENEWLINGLFFDAHHPLAFPKRGGPEVWTIENGGGGWTHPMHFHQEEHRVLSRNGVPTVEPPRPTIDSDGNVHPALVNGRHADDWSKEDTIAHEPGEEVVIYRNFRTFPADPYEEAPYVAHCHNLAHEDHNMMFGFTICNKP